MTTTATTATINPNRKVVTTTNGQLVEVPTEYTTEITNDDIAHDGQIVIIEAAKWGDLTDYTTGEYLRPATRDEEAASIGAATKDSGAGVIALSDGTSVFVA